MSEQGHRTGAGRTHRVGPVTGRDPNEHGRTATMLELLHDLVFVIAIGPSPSAMIAGPP